jgi:hypothetical protein
MTLPVTLPSILDLKWHPQSGDGTYAAEPTSHFVRAEGYVMHRLPYPAGIIRQSLAVIYDPATADHDAVLNWSAELNACHARIKEGERANRAARAARAAENKVADAEKRKRYHDYAGPNHAAAVREAIAEGRALFAEHGVAVRKVKPLNDLLDLVYLEPRELTKLRKIIRECRENISAMEGDARKLAKSTDVELDDDFVVRGLRLLTELDADRGAEKNYRGWGRDTSAPGHWCCALLKTDREKAIEIGRGLVAHHLGQLAKLGLVPAAVRSVGAASCSQ